MTIAQKILHNTRVAKIKILKDQVKKAKERVVHLEQKIEKLKKLTGTSIWLE